MDYRPQFTGLGILAGWTIAILGPSFYLRRRIGPRRWRQLHRWTIAGWALAVVHVLGAGTDAGQWWLQAIIAVTAVPIAGLFALRVFTPAPAPRPESTGGRLCAHGRAASICAASLSSVTSSPARPQSWTASGRPSESNPAGTDAAGWPMTFHGAV